MGYKNPVWHNGMAPSINDDRLNDLCYTVERLDFADGRVVVGQKEGETLGTNVTSEGTNTIASGANSHAEGGGTKSVGANSHAEGGFSQANEAYSHAEGSNTKANGQSSHAEGSGSTASGASAHAEGGATVASGEQSHSEGGGTNATGDYSHAEGWGTTASGTNSHAEGYQTKATEQAAHAEGFETRAVGEHSHVEGSGRVFTIGTINGPVSSGETTYTVDSLASGVEVGAVVMVSDNGGAGFFTKGAIVESRTSTTITVSESLNPDSALPSGKSVGLYYAQGIAYGENAHAEGNRTVASGDASHSEGSTTLASGSISHAEGFNTVARGVNSHAEGNGSTASGDASHTEGTRTEASGASSHSEGAFTTAGGKQSHSEGNGTRASGDYSHAENRNTMASGENSHAEGLNTTAAGTCQHVFGQWNVSNTTDVEIVGWGTLETQKNIRTLDQSGNMTISGTLTQSSDAKLKTVEGEIPDVSEIHAVRFRWNDVNGQHDDLEHVGYIAQDVEKVAPFMVKEDSNGYKALDYIAFLCAKMELLERRVKELEEKKE